MEQPVTCLSPGDRLPNFTLPDATGKTRIFYNELKGRPVVLFAWGKLGELEQGEALASVAGALKEHAEVFVIGGEDLANNAAVAEQLGADIPLFVDQAGVVLSPLLAPVPPTFPEASPFQPRFCTYLLDPNQRVLAVLRRESAAEQGARVLALLSELKQTDGECYTLDCSAPVLMLPAVFDPDFCQELIETWRTKGHHEGGLSTGKGNVYAPESKKNLEHVLSDATLNKKVSLTLAKRIGPELAKVFCYGDPFRFEASYIMRYQEQRRDFFGIHRDNLRANQQRRFAVSVNLNDGYDGGEIRFPEYGPHGYRPPAGGALVFSGSLLHEARPVTRGERFVLVNFFCDAQEPDSRIPAARRRQMQV